MRVRIGLGIEGDAVHAVAVRRRQVVWKGSAAVPSEERIRDVITGLLKTCPQIKGARVWASLGATHSRVKKLQGFEHVTRRELVEQAIQTNPERFFLKYEGGLLFGRALPAESGVWRVAAFTQTTALAVEAACADAGAELVKSMVVEPGAAVPSDLEPAYASAYGAVTCTVPLYVDSNTTSAKRRMRRTARRRVLGAFVAIACLGVVVAPTVNAERQRRIAQSRLAQSRVSLRPVAASMAALAHATTMLRRIDDFDRSRRSMLRYLGSLTDALPESTAVLSMRVDTATATTVIITRSGPTVLGEFAAMPEVHSPKLLGAVSRESVGGVEYDRLAIRAFVVSRDTTHTRKQVP